jgi:WD40 repeat protein
LLAVDGQKFILKTFDPVSVSAAHIYHSALPFTPENSHLKRYYADDLEVEPRVIIGVPSHWEGPLRTLEMPYPEKAQKNTRVRAVEYSHSGTMLAIGGGSHNSGFSYLYRSGTGERLAELDCANRYIRAVTFSHDDKVVATAHSRTVTIWDTCSGARINELSLPAAAKETTINSAAFHPSSEPLTAGVLFCSMDDGRVFLWDVAANPTNPQHKFEFIAPDTTGVACWLSHSDQHIILLGSTSGHVERWDVSNPERINHTTFPLPSPDVDAISAIASSKDGSLAASGSKNGSLIVYNTITEEVIRYFRKESTIRALQFSPFYKQANVLSFALGRTIHIFSPDSEGSGAVVSLEGHYRDVKCIAFSPNGRLVASGSYDNSVNIWETTRDVKAHMESIQHHSQPIRCTHFSTDRQLIISGSDDKTIRVRSAAGARHDDSAHPPVDTVFTLHSHRIREAVLLSDGKHVVSVDGHHRIIVWDWSQNKIICEHTLSAKAAKEHGGVSWIFPYTHLALGFFSIHKRLILCWNIDLDNGRLSITARGSVPAESVVRISHQPQEKVGPTAIALVVECKSGKQFKAVWRDAYGDVKSPTVFTFERLKADVQRSSKARPRAYIGSEVPCRQPEDNKWILDESGRKILWVPPNHRGAIFRHGDQLILEGGSGRLTVVDFSDVKDVQPESF